MFGKNVLFAAGAIALAALVAGCNQNPSGAASSSATDTNRQTFEVKGVLKDLKPNGKTAVIAHEEIPDYMPAMTMDLDVKDKRELEGLRPGDPIQFRMVVTKDDGWIENVRKLPKAAPTNANERVAMPTPGGTNDPVTFRRSPDVELLNIGDVVPDYKLTNQFGQPISLAQFRGRALGVTFVFTRCPFPTFCPRMSQHFEKAQKALKAQPATNWTLLSITIDPEYDTPERLKKYTAAYNVDTNHWFFAVSDLWTLDGFSEQVGLTFFRDTPQALPQHNLRTVVIDARGRLHKVFTGNEWSPDEFAIEMLKAANVK